MLLCCMEKNSHLKNSVAQSSFVQGGAGHMAGHKAGHMAGYMAGHIAGHKAGHMAGQMALHNPGLCRVV